MCFFTIVSLRCLYDKYASLDVVHCIRFGENCEVLKFDLSITRCGNEQAKLCRIKILKVR